MVDSFSRIIRHGDSVILNIRLEFTHRDRFRHFVIVSSECSNTLIPNYSILGIDEIVNNEIEMKIGLSVPINRNTNFHLDGDGGFSVFTPEFHFSFRPISVSALWTAIQTLSMISQKLTKFPPKILSTNSTNYVINSYQSCINEWHSMADVLVRRPSSPKDENFPTESLIKLKLRDVMKIMNLDNMTSKEIRTTLETLMNTRLDDYKSLIDKEILLILGQMDPSSKILDYLYLGSEWNANNLEELRHNGITHILNVTIEIDNFFPALFTYRNIRVYDEEGTDLLKWFDETYRFIKQAHESNGKILIHCKMGISRSATVTVCYIMKENQMSLEDAIFHVKGRRDIINPNKAFIKQLEVYEGILGAISNRHNTLFRSKSESSLKSVDDNYEQNIHKKQWNINVKALANVFNQSEDVQLAERPKSWSPNEKQISELSLENSWQCSMEEELELASKPVVFHDRDFEIDDIVHHISDVSVQHRALLAEVEKQQIRSLSNSSTITSQSDDKEELSVKTIAKLYDFKGSVKIQSKSTQWEDAF